MEDFEKLVKRCYEGQLPDEIDNGSIEHAKILVEYLFKLAKTQKHDVKIITGRLHGEFYKSFAGVAEEILNTNTITIISQNDCDDSQFERIVRASPRGEIITAHGVKLPHFILVGNSAYRYENDDLLKTAKASFNKPSMGLFLMDLFEKVRKFVEPTAQATTA